MKHFFLFLVLFAFQSDTATDYNLLIGSWKQKAIANTADTGIFTFNADSTATLEMRKATTDDLIGSVKGPYSLNKKEGTVQITFMGRPKTFKILKLEPKVLTLKNISENKEPQTFERVDTKE